MGIKVAITIYRNILCHYEKQWLNYFNHGKSSFPLDNKCHHHRDDLHYIIPWIHINESNIYSVMSNCMDPISMILRRRRKHKQTHNPRIEIWNERGNTPPPKKNQRKNNGVLQRMDLVVCKCACMCIYMYRCFYK